MQNNACQGPFAFARDTLWMACTDDEPWENHSGKSCADYSSESWCARGGFVPGAEWTGGEQFNWPERHCCECGKAGPRALAVTDELYRIANEQNCDLLYSADRYLDFLPRGVNKGSTLRRLVHDLGIDMNQVLVAGDTLNDLSMFEQGFRGVCVGQRRSCCMT